MSEFEPKIVAFLCNWCAYRGADLAGTSRFHYPSNVRVIRLMCSSSIDPVYVLEALLNGADGVLVAGCHPGNCHYVDGNYKATRRIEVLKNVLQQAGIDEDRVWLRWRSPWNGTYRRESVTELIRKASARAANSSPGALPGSNSALAGNSPFRLHNSVTLPYY